MLRRSDWRGAGWAAMEPRRLRLARLAGRLAKRREQRARNLRAEIPSSFARLESMVAVPRWRRDSFTVPPPLARDLQLGSQPPAVGRSANALLSVDLARGAQAEVNAAIILREVS